MLIELQSTTNFVGRTIVWWCFELEGEFMIQWMVLHVTSADKKRSMKRAFVPTSIHLQPQENITFVRCASVTAMEKPWRKWNKILPGFVPTVATSAIAHFAENTKENPQQEFWLPLQKRRATAQLLNISTGNNLFLTHSRWLNKQQHHNNNGEDEHPLKRDLHLCNILRSRIFSRTFSHLINLGNIHYVYVAVVVTACTSLC